MDDLWPFHDSPNVAVITLVQIIEQGHPVLYVTHDDDDGAWQFLGRIVFVCIMMLIKRRHVSLFLRSGENMVTA
jgi:hypothetical protein